MENRKPNEKEKKYGAGITFGHFKIGSLLLGYCTVENIEYV